jgi:hypothetical protein
VVLADDAARQAASGAAEGLKEFTEAGWSHGSVFTREQLLQARDGKLPEAPDRLVD